jgi:hypothetical protein
VLFDDTGEILPDGASSRRTEPARLARLLAA